MYERSTGYGVRGTGYGVRYDAPAVSLSTGHCVDCRHGASSASVQSLTPQSLHARLKMSSAVSGPAVHGRPGRPAGGSGGIRPRRQRVADALAQDLDATTTSPASTGTCTSPAAGRRVRCSRLAAVATSSDSCACRGRSYADSGDNAPLPSV